MKNSASRRKRLLDSEVHYHDNGKRMGETKLRASVGQPVPAVSAEDVRRVYYAVAEAGPRNSISLELLAELCDPGVNVVAVSLRAMLLSILLQIGRLGQWQEGKVLNDRLYQVAATFPLPRGLEEVDPEAFVAAVEQFVIG